MKKITTLALSVLLMLNLAACSQTDSGTFGTSAAESISGTDSAAAKASDTQDDPFAEEVELLLYSSGSSG